MHSRDRPQGMFTYEDRAYLLGETTPNTAAAERKKRARIRRRVRNAIVDFSLLVHLEWDDLELVFEGLVDEEGAVADRELYDGMVDAVETVVRNAALQGLDVDRILTLATLRSIGVYSLLYEGELVAVDRTHEVAIDPDRSIPLAEASARLDSIDDVPLAAALALEEFGIDSLEALDELVSLE